MSVLTPAHDENVAQASCLHERRLPRKAGRYIFVVILFSTVMIPGAQKDSF